MNGFFFPDEEVPKKILFLHGEWRWEGAKAVVGQELLPGKQVAVNFHQLETPKTNLTVA